MTEFEAQEYFKELLKEGKDILHLSFSGAMSSTADNFKRAAKTLNQIHTNQIYVLDTLCQSGGLGLIVNMVAEEIESKNLSITDAYNFADSVKLNITHYFTVDNLTFLARGGRISSTTALIGNIIKIKPILHLNDDGVIVQFQKVISRKKTLAVLEEKVYECWNKQYKKIYISEADAKTEADIIAKNLQNKLGVETVVVPLGAVVCNHSGPGTLAIFFTSNTR